MQNGEHTRIALITGAGKRTGLGFETASQLGARGYRVLVTARDGNVGRERAHDLCQRGYDVLGYQLDVEDPVSVAALTSRVRELGHLDVLINNAARAAVYGERPSKADLESVRSSVESILFGAWRLTQSVLPLLLLSPHPRIVNVSSGAGSHGDAQFGLTTANAMGPGYAVAKAALNALTVSFANELRDLYVLVNAVCPGFTDTFPGAAAMGARPVAEGAAGIVWAATLPDGGPSGGFFRDAEPLPW